MRAWGRALLSAPIKKRLRLASFSAPQAGRLGRCIRKRIFRLLEIDA
jgi:hypothetical protein